jgi:uncharacterized protein (TIGR03790 family)
MKALLNGAVVALAGPGVALAGPGVALAVSVVALAVSLVCVHPAAAAQSRHSPDEVLLVINGDSPASVAIAKHYADKRRIHNQLVIHCADSALSAKNETLSLSDYNSQIAAPVSAFLDRHPAINFIVLTKGVPIRVDGAVTGSRGEHTRGNYRASVDSYLAAADYALPAPSHAQPASALAQPASTHPAAAKKIKIHGSGADGYAWLNRYWNATEPFSHARFGGYLVTRLDGYTQADALALIDRAQPAKPTPDAKILLDVQPAFGLGNKSAEPFAVTGDVPDESAWSGWNADMIKAADELAHTSIPFELDLNAAFVGNRANLLGYFSWGSNDPKFSPSAYQSLTFAPGSIADTAVSTSARSLLPTNDGGQSLIGDLIAHGVTGIKGYTDEPELQAIASPSIAVDRYFIRGMTLAETFYAASRFVGWTDIVIGDPLATCANPAAASPHSSKPARKHP